MKALLIGGEKDGEIMEVESADIPSLCFMLAPGIPIRRTENADNGIVETKRLEYWKLVAIDGVTIYTCLDYEDGIRALAEAYTKRVNLREVEAWKYKTLQVIDNYAAAVAMGDYSPRNIVKAQVQQVAELLK